jgi:NRPS condensation-like uncharacterized protein
MGRPRAGTRLNCMDKALFALYSKAEPMVNHCILTIDGVVDPVKLKSALLTTLLLHPSLTSTIHSGLFRQVREAKSDYGNDVLTVWDLAVPQDVAGANRGHIDAAYEKRLSEWLNRPLDPCKDLPLRLLLLRKTLEEFSLVFTCHHAAADGLHVLRFIGDVVQEYNGHDQNASASTYPLPDGGRDELVAWAQACRRRVKHFYFRMIASLVHRFLLAPLSPNARICRASSKGSREMYFCQGALNSHEVRQIRSRAESAGATLNDALLAASCRAVEQWNDAHGKPSRKISVMVPVSIGDRISSPVIANQVSFISVPTTRKERSDPEGLLHTVRQRTSRMLSNGIAFSIVYAVYSCSHLPPGFSRSVARFLMATQVYLDSILLTNVGRVGLGDGASLEGDKMGNARITSVAGLCPVVSPMGISLCAARYNDHLRVALTYKTRQLSQEQARTFLNVYLHELRGYQRTPEGLLMPEVRYREARENVPV